MCLPTGLLSFIAKSCTIYILGFSLYCLYQYVASGFASILKQSLPLLLTVLVFLLTGLCSCIGLNKKYLVSGICTLLLAIITFSLVIFLNSFAHEFFDITKGCDQLIKSNSMFEVFIDHNIDHYFNESTSLLCSKECPCKWTEKTEVLKKYPSRFAVDQQKGAKSVIECPGFLDDLKFNMEKKQYLQDMLKLEVYGCSGYCKQKDIFSLTDINLGQPKYSCFDVSRQLQRLTYNTVLIGMYFLSWALLVLIPTTCCIFYKFNRESSEREEMIEKVEKIKSELGPIKKFKKNKLGESEDSVSQESVGKGDKQDSKEEQTKDESDNKEKQPLIEKDQQPIEQKESVDKKND